MRWSCAAPPERIVSRSLPVKACRRRHFAPRVKQTHRTGKTTAKGHSWTRTRVATLRNIHGIAVYREGERAERGEATLDEAAETLAVSPATVRRLIVEGALPANQICKGAPWVIRTADIQSAEVASAAERRRKHAPRTPPSEDQPALPLNFQ